MAEGRIKWYSDKKNYGFIEMDNGEDIFIHSSGIEDHGHFGIRKDDRVSFEIKETHRGSQAFKVKPIS